MKKMELKIIIRDRVTKVAQEFTLVGDISQMVGMNPDITDIAFAIEYAINGNPALRAHVTLEE